MFIAKYQVKATVDLYVLKVLSRDQTIGEGNTF